MFEVRRGARHLKLASIFLLTGVLFASTASLAQEEKPGFFENLFGLGKELSVPRADARNIAWKAGLPAGLYDGDYSTCVAVTGAQRLDVGSTVIVHFDRPAKITGAAVFVRRLSEEGDVNGEFLDEGFFWNSSLGKVSQLGTNATARISAGSPPTTSDIKFVITEVSAADTNVCLTELDIYGSFEEEENAPVRKTGLEGNWIVEYSDAGKKAGTGTTYGYGEKGHTIFGTYSVWPTDDTASNGVWSSTSCVTRHDSYGCGDGSFTESPEGKINIQHGYGMFGLWGGESNLKQVGPDEIRGQWNYQEKYGGAEVWRRVQPEITRVVLSSKVADDYNPGDRPGRVEMTYDGYWWGPTSDMRANRPSFNFTIYGENLWGHRRIRIEPKSNSENIVEWDLELRGAGRIRVAGHGPPSDVVGLSMEVLAWAGAVPGRKTLYIDDVAVPFDFIVHGHPKEKDVVWPDDATTPEDLKDEPALEYAVSLTPDPGVAGERVEFKYSLKNTSRDHDLSNVKLDIIFQPMLESDGSETVFGRYMDWDERCRAGAADTLELNEEEFASSASDYSYHCSVATLAAGAEVAFAFGQEEAVPGETDYFGIFSASETEEVRAAPSATLIVEPGEAKLSVVAPQFTEPAYTGGEFHTTFTITNTGNARVMMPVLDIEFSGDAAVTKESGASAAVDPGALKASAVLESDEPEEEGVLYEGACKTTAKGFHCEVVPESSFSAGDPYLEPGASERITLSFSPNRAGELTLAARAQGTSHDGKKISDEHSVSTDVEGPEIAIKLQAVSPMSDGQITNAQGDILQVHKGNTLELTYLLTNTAKRASLLSGFFQFKALGGKISDLVIAELNRECLSPGQTDEGYIVCSIDDFGPGGELTVIGEATYQGGVEIEALVANEVTLPDLFDDYLGGGTPPKEVHWYLAGVTVAPEIELSFDPAVELDPLQSIDNRFDGMLGGVAPGQKISAHFSIGTAGKETIHGGILEINLPVAETAAPYSIENVSGCIDVSGNPTLYCWLPPFTKDKPADVNIQFSEARPENIGKKHTFTWSVILPDTYVVEAAAPMSGNVTYEVEPRYADMKVEGEQTPDTATAGESNLLIFAISNEGNWPEQQVRVAVSVWIKDLKGPGKKRVTSVYMQLPGLEDRRTLRKVGCPLSAASATSDAHCALGDIGPSDIAFIEVDWVPQPEDIGKIFYYRIVVDKGLGEGDVGGSTEDNIATSGGEIRE